MNEKPILFSTAMVRALLDGTKTQTRRVMKPQPRHRIIKGTDGEWYDTDCINPGTLVKCPYQVGMRLWVREEHYRYGHWEPVPGKKTKTGRQKWRFIADSNEVLFDTPATFRKGRHNKDPETVAWYKRLGRFMPRRLARITLEITDVRAERVQDISEADAKAEGVIWTQRETAPQSGKFEPCAREQFKVLWDSINAKWGYGWEKNPWVWVIGFKRI